MMNTGERSDRTVVIGAGMGGLATALRLAAAGREVTVIEMAPGPGGKARTLPSPAGPVDTGPTVLTMRWVADELFALAGQRMEEGVDIIPLPELARHYWPDGSQLVLYPDAEANIAAIRDFAGPAEAEAFRRFDRLASELFASFDGPVMQAGKPQLGQIARAALRRPGLWRALAPGMTLERLLQSHFRDPRLVQLFGRYATYVGGRPAQTPAVLSLVWRAEATGVWAIRQGMHGLAEALMRGAMALGVEFRFGTRARRIIRQQGRVSGVEIDGGATLRCGTCVFNGDPGALAEGRLGDAAQAALARPGAARRSLSAWVWAFAAKPLGPVLGHHTVFFTANPGQEFGPIGQGQMPLDPTLYVCAQDRGWAATPTGPERFEIIMNGPAGIDRREGEESECRTRTFQTLARHGLTFRPEPELTGLTSPQRLAELYPGSRGAIYGASPEGTMAAFRRPTARTGLPGLYLAGGGVHPGPGVPMALLSGKLAARAVLEDLTSASPPARTATPGGMLTGSRMTARAPSR